MEYEVHQRDRFVEVVTHGAATVTGFREFLDEMFALREWKPGTPVLVNHSDLRAGHLTADDIRAIAGLVMVARAEFGASRMAILVARDVEYGLARMWQAYVENKWDGDDQVFRSRDEAVRWLAPA